jgi:hypothetical protein
MTTIEENELDLMGNQAETATPESMGEVNESPEQSDDKPKGHYKTLVQLSQEYGLTRQGMKLRLNKMLTEVKANGLNESDYVVRGLRNTVYVLEPGLEWLAKLNDNNTPMRAPVQNIDLELYKAEQAEQRARESEERQAEMKKTIEFLQGEVIAKTNQINGLTATIAQQAKIIDNQSNELLRLTAPKPEPMGETAEETTAQNVENDPKTAVSNSDDKITAELSKLSFMGKLKLLFS